MKTPALRELSSERLRFETEQLFKRVQPEYEPYSVAQNYAFKVEDRVDSLQVNAAAGNLTITLPSPTGNRRRRVIKTDASVNSVQVYGTDFSVFLLDRYDYVEVEPTGTGWLIVGGPFFYGNLYIGKGVQFPGVQVPSSDPNTLDDYEEGTWLPVVTIGGSSVGVTYSEQAGAYTKIGRFVHVRMRLVLSSKAALVGDVVITGLPFTCANDGITTALAGTGNVLAAGVTSPVAFIVSVNTTAITVVKFATGSYSIAQDTDLTNTSVFNIAGGYNV